MRIFKETIGRSSGNIRFKDFQLPVGASVLSSDIQDGLIKFWYMINETSNTEIEKAVKKTVSFMLVFTGEPVDFPDDDECAYAHLTTLVEEEYGLVTHVFYCDPEEWEWDAPNEDEAVG